MRIQTLLFTLATAGMLAASGAAFSQQPPESGPRGPQGMMGGNMMGGGGMIGGGMMNMMQQCERMMGARGGHGVPQLPPGNEKLQLQMQAEMMQRMGEILAKYAAQVK